MKITEINWTENNKCSNWTKTQKSYSAQITLRNSITLTTRSLYNASSSTTLVFCIRTRTLSLLNSYCTLFAFVLAGVSTNTAFSISFVFSRPIAHVSRKRPWPGSRRPFPRNCSLERTDDTLIYPTMPRLSRHCLRFGRYLRPFVRDTTIMLLFKISLKTNF